MARASRGSPGRLLAGVFAVAALITAALSPDATVVLLTPVVFATAYRIGVRPKPHVYACTHLANSASLLLPVSNLTNLLAFSASTLSFARFSALMTLPWLVTIGIEYLVLRRVFRADLAVGAGAGEPPRTAPPVFALVVLGLTFAGFPAGSPRTGRTAASRRWSTTGWATCWRVGPRSVGPATRFVVDHVPCPVLLVWPGEAPGVDSIPPGAEPPPPPHERH